MDQHLPWRACLYHCLWRQGRQVQSPGWTGRKMGQPAAACVPSARDSSRWKTGQRTLLVYTLIYSKELIIRLVLTMCMLFYSEPPVSGTQKFILIFSVSPSLLSRYYMLISSVSRWILSRISMWIYRFLLWLLSRYYMWIYRFIPWLLAWYSMWIFRVSTGYYHGILCAFLASYSGYYQGILCEFLVSYASLSKYTNTYTNI